MSRPNTYHLFQPTPSLRRATAYPGNLRTSRRGFQPTPSLRRATATRHTFWQAPNHFNPRPPCGGRPYGVYVGAVLYEFQPTPSLRRATHGRRQGGGRGHISTHALLAEGDRWRVRTADAGANISTHALLAEGDAPRATTSTESSIFQPTPSLRRATEAADTTPEAAAFQPTPSLRRATIREFKLYRWDEFQPTPSLRRATLKGDGIKVKQEFQPTPSLRRATYALAEVVHLVPISTHALLAEGDLRHGCQWHGALCHFNPRPPCGGRQEED